MKNAEKFSNLHITRLFTYFYIIYKKTVAQCWKFAEHLICSLWSCSLRNILSCVSYTAVQCGYDKSQVPARSHWQSICPLYRWEVEKVWRFLC